MNVIQLPVQKMTREAFAPFGIVLDRRGSIDVDIGMGVPSITGATATGCDERRWIECASTWKATASRVS